ncbi:MAG: RNA polymerase sigma factor [Coprobacillaceae bacterium]
MIDQSNLEQFNKIYNDTYDRTLRFIVCKCQNINDANDIIQETYIELHKIMNKKELSYENIQAYVMKIAFYKIRQHYTLLQRIRSIHFFTKSNEDVEYVDQIKDGIDIEEMIRNESLCHEIWEYVKSKDIMIGRIFFLKFYSELTIKEIAEELHVGESYIKNCLYRTLKEVKKHFGKDEII